MPGAERPASWRRRRQVLVGAAAASVLLFVAVYALAVETVDGERLDRAGLGARDLFSLEDFRRPGVLFLSTIGLLSIAAAGGTVMAVAAIRRRPRLALAAGAIILGANLTTQTVKRVALPASWDAWGRDFTEAPAFPSGHSTVAMSLAVALVLVTPAHRQAVSAVVGLAYATAIGAATVVAGWHRPSEVLAAYLVVAGWTALVVAMLPAETSAATRAETGTRRGVRLLLWASALVAVTALGAGAVFLRSDRVQRAVGETADGLALVAGLGAVAALSFVVVAGLILALRGVALDPPHRPRGGDVESPAGRLGQVGVSR